MAKYIVRVSGMLESNEWFEVDAENEEEAEDKACDCAETEGYEDPMMVGKPKLRT